MRGDMEFGVTQTNRRPYVSRAARDRCLTGAPALTAALLHMAEALKCQSALVKPVELDMRSTHVIEFSCSSCGHVVEEDKASAQAAAGKKAAKMEQATTPKEATDARGDAMKAQARADKKNTPRRSTRTRNTKPPRMLTWLRRRPTRRRSRRKVTQTKRPPMLR